jgi:hypothetical protein
MRLKLKISKIDSHKQLREKHFEEKLVKKTQESEKISSSRFESADKNASNFLIKKHLGFSVTFNLRPTSCLAQHSCDFDRKLVTAIIKIKSSLASQLQPKTLPFMRLYVIQKQRDLWDISVANCKLIFLMTLSRKLLN